MLWLDYYWHKVLKRPYTLAKRIDKGHGQPVVFLHGIASNGENWRQVAEMLDEKKYRVIVLDLLGFGDSPRPDWLDYSVEDHAKAVLASLSRMRVYKPVILVGHSMGGLVSAHIASKKPHRVKQLILYQMPIYAEIPKLQDFRRQTYLSVYKYLAEHPKITLWYSKFLGKTASKVAGFELNEDTWQPFELSLKNTIMQQDSLSNLRSLKIPTDVVYGKYDIFVMSKTLQYIFRPSKNVRFYEIDDIHRVSDRSSLLLFDLITQDPASDRVLTTKHARLVDMHKNIAEDVDLVTSPSRWSSAAILFTLLCSTALLGWASYLAIKGLAAFEKSWFVSINGGSAPVMIETIARSASDTVWLFAAVVALGLVFKQTRKLAFRTSAMAVIVNACVLGVEHIVNRMRPAELLPNDTVQRAFQDGAGFPSSHTATITIIVLMIWPSLTPIMRIGTILLVVLVGWSRIFLGVHFPLDVVGGFACALIVYCIYRLIPERFLKKVWLA